MSMIVWSFLPHSVGAPVHIQVSKFIAALTRIKLLLVMNDLIMHSLLFQSYVWKGDLKLVFVAF